MPTSLDPPMLRLHRARPLLGTLVSIQVCEPARAGAPDILRIEQAVGHAFEAIRHIEQVMSAHHADSDLGRLARATPHVSVTVDPHTVTVLQLAADWRRRSNGAFDPVLAAVRLASVGRRPGFNGVAAVPGAGLRDLCVESGSTVQLARPLQIDLGGIAKGYAVDQAIEALRRHGVTSALVNAGGDLRAIGPLSWPVEIQHAQVTSQSRRLTGLRTLREGALATSVGVPVNPDFIPTRTVRPRAHRWQQCTVRAHDCVSADVLTKWGLQAVSPSLGLRAALRQHGGQLWRA